MNISIILCIILFIIGSSYLLYSYNLKTNGKIFPYTRKNLTEKEKKEKVRNSYIYGVILITGAFISLLYYFIYPKYILHKLNKLFDIHGKNDKDKKAITRDCDTYFATLGRNDSVLLSQYNDMKLTKPQDEIINLCKTTVKTHMM